MFGRKTRLAGLAAVLALAVTTIAAPHIRSAAAYEPPAGTVEYAIHHSKYKRIGTHSVSFSRSGSDLIVDVVIQIKVKLLFFTAHSLEAARREVWRGGKFVGYQGRTDENGKLVKVNARTDGDGLAINGGNGTVRADPSVFPTHPWNPDIVNRSLLMETKTGELLDVTTRPDGEETIEVAGKPVKTTRYVMAGDLERELWFDGGGNWIQLRFKRDGATLTFTRITPVP